MRGTKKRLITAKDYVYLISSGEALLAYRQLRAPLLEAFDIYKSLVGYGVLVESEETHQAVLTWYQALLACEAWALEDVPASVQPYVGGAR